MEFDIVNKLYLELSQVATAKTKRELELERALKRQSESHASIACCLRGGATDAGMTGCIKQCDQFVSEAHEILGPKNSGGFM